MLLVRKSIIRQLDQWRIVLEAKNSWKYQFPEKLGPLNMFNTLRAWKSFLIFIIENDMMPRGGALCPQIKSQTEIEIIRQFPFCSLPACLRRLAVPSVSTNAQEMWYPATLFEDIQLAKYKISFSTDVKSNKTAFYQYLLLKDAHYSDPQIMGSSCRTSNATSSKWFCCFCKIFPRVWEIAKIFTSWVDISIDATKSTNTRSNMVGVLLPPSSLISENYFLLW